MSSGLVPVNAPSPRIYLAERAKRLRLAVTEIRDEFAHLEKRIKEVQHDLILVLSALDALEDDDKQSEVLP